MSLTNLTKGKVNKGDFLKVFVFAESGSAPLAGQSIYLSIMRESDELRFDFDDNVFKITPDEPSVVLIAVAGFPGLYGVSVDLVSLIEPDHLVFSASTGSMLTVFDVDVINRDDFVSDLAVSYDAEAEKFNFVATLLSKDGLVDSSEAEPLLRVFDSEGNHIFEALHGDFTENNGVFLYEYSGTGIERGSWVAYLRFDAFNTSVVLQQSFNVG